MPFLYGDLDKEVYLKISPDFKSSYPGMVYHLRKSIYGLRPSPRCSSDKLVVALKDYGFMKSYSGYSVFTYIEGGVQINVLFLCFDLIIFESDFHALKMFKDYLCSCFSMNDLGVLKYFLGVEVARNPQELFLHQRKYALDIIFESSLFGAKPAILPIEQNNNLGHDTSIYRADLEKYRRLVRRLFYLAVTCLDFSYTDHILSHFLQNPRLEHSDAALHTILYLKGAPGQGILLHFDSELSLTG